MNTLYYKSPYPLKIVWASLAAWYKKHQKYGKFFHEYFNFLINTPPELHKQKAQEELKTFLQWVKTHIPVYTIEETLENMPIIDKKWVQQHYQQLTVEKPYRIVRSSGTTGRPLAVPYNMRSYQKEYAFWWYHRSFGDVHMGDRIATLSGHKVVHIDNNAPPFWVYNKTENQLIFSSYHLSQNNLIHYVQALNRFKPHLIHGYPSSIYLLAKFILENDITLTFRPKMIITASETTLDFQKQIIENAFKCKNYIWYGNTEYAGHITECSYGKLHVQPYHSYVRIVTPEGKDAKPGEEGFIVATNFTNTAFPLINYNTYDIVRVSKEQHCKCGQTGLIVDYILGRIEDYIVTPDGRMVGRLDHLFKDAKYVRNAQLEQSTPEQIIIRIEREPGYNSKIEKIIEKEARKRLGNEIDIVFDYVTEIPKQANGKFKFIIQRINNRELYLSA